MNEQFFTSLNGYKVKDKYALHTYDSVAVMKGDTKLKEGMYVKTKGYYSANDNGSAEYIITNTQSNSDYQEELNNNLYATLIIENGSINIRQVGCKEGIDNTDKIQYCLNNYDVTIIPVGRFECNSTLSIPEKHTLRGIDKNNSILKYNGSTTFIENQDIDTNAFIVIENLAIYGSSKTGIGICLSRTASVDGYGSSWHRLTGLILGGFETGLEVRKNQNETQFSDIHCRNNINGIRIINGVSDMYFEKIVCSRNDNVGIYLFQVTETRFSDLKCWYNGNKTGAYNNMRIDSCLALMFVNLSLQDAFGNNCYISSSNNINMINTWFDTPQNDTVDTCYQLKLKNVSKSKFNIKGRNRKVNNDYVNKILQLDDNNEQNEIIFNCENDYPYSLLLNETNSASINNVALKNTIVFQDKIINYNDNLNYVVNGNLQDKSTLNWINSGKDSCEWNNNLLRATATDSPLTLEFKTGKRNNLGLHTFYIKFSVNSGTGNVTFKNTTIECSPNNTYYASFTVYFDNLNRINNYLSLTIPSGMIIDISEIGCCEGASAKLGYPLSQNALS